MRNKNKPVRFICPYCNKETSTDVFFEHCYNKHPDITLKLPVTKEYLDERFSVLGGITYIGENVDPT